MHWKKKIYESAYKIANEFKKHPKVIGVAIGGSVARGVVWKHSDLELCLVVEERINEYQHFNFINGLGVEIIQILKSQMVEFLDSFTDSDTEILRFPLQIYKCKIIYDPASVLVKFKNIYDKHLFHPNITSIRKMKLLDRADKRFNIAKELLAKGFHKTSLAYIRIGINDLLLAYYWHYNILPKSQNRTVYFLKKNSKIIGHDKLYKAFIVIFGLNKPTAYLKESLLKAKENIVLVSKKWGSNAPEFLEKACDGNLEWGYPKSIIYVYKFCMHILQCNDSTQEDIYDTESFKSELRYLHDFLDFNDIKPETVKNMLVQFEEVRNMI